MATPSTNLAQEATRERLIETALQMFAERGYERTSIRELTAEADCNVAAVNYYFGGKHPLYLEAFRRLLTELRDYRVRRIREAMAHAGEQATLETFLEAFATAFLEPLVNGSRGRIVMAFMEQEMRIRLVPVDVFVREFIGPILDVTLDALDQVAPPMPRTVSRLCLVSLVGQLMHVVRIRNWLADDASPLFSSDLDEQIDHIVRFSAAGIRACATTPEIAES